MQGLVLKSTGKIYNIILENGEIVKATIRGKLRIEGLKTTNPLNAYIVYSLEKEIQDLKVILSKFKYRLREEKLNELLN